MERRWESVELPANFVLDLLSGVVASRPEGERPTLAYSRGLLVSESPLRLLPSAGEAGPRARVERDGGEAVPGTTPIVGQELVFDCFDEAWGYLRVLAVSPEVVTLEYLLEPDLRTRELRREPAVLGAESGPAGVLLRWENPDGEIHRIERRRVARGRNDRRGDWNEVARSGDSQWVDDEVSLGSLTEYRVSREGAGGGFGSTALGVPGIEPPETRAQFAPGTDVNLLSLVDDGLRSDLRIEYVRPGGVQIFTPEGVAARELTSEAEQSWRLPESYFDGYAHKERFVVPPGRVLAMRLPEGVWCLLRVEEVREQSATLSRQLDLGGERVFPPTPAQPAARWEPERGVVFDFPEPRSAPPLGEPLLVVEREETLDAGDWKARVVGEPGQRRLVDEGIGEQLLVRFRFRQGLNLEHISLPTEPLTVLVGGDSDADRAATLERAILDLGSEDYDRRGQARAVLLNLGESAWPDLKQALRSNNPELAAAARELILTTLEDMGDDRDELAGNLAGLFLGNRAEELGSASPPHPDWISPEAGARASAALRGLGWRMAGADQVALWRRVLAEADLEDMVRQAASLAAQIAEQGLGPDLVPRSPSFARDVPGADDWLDEPDLDLPAPVRGLQPWAELVQLQARHELELSRRLASQELSLVQERSVLARYLSSHYDRTGDDLFLDCALRLIEDPVARLRGALDLARARQRAPRTVAGEGPLHVIRLETASTERLVEELDLLPEGGERPVEIVLPAGSYEALEGNRQIVVEGARFRLRGEGEVRIYAGFSLLKGCQASFENLEIVPLPETGYAVSVIRSQLSLRDCTLRGGALGLQGSDAVVELERSVILAPDGPGRNTSGVRLSGRSMLLASESRIESAGVAVQGARAALLDRCVVVSRTRNGIEGGTGGELWLVNSLVRADKAPFSRVTRGVVDGAVLQGDLDAGLSPANGLAVCAEHLRCDVELSSFERGTWLPGCTLGR